MHTPHETVAAPACARPWRGGLAAVLLSIAGSVPASVLSGDALGAWVNPVATEGVSISNEDASGVALIEWGTPAEGSFTSRLEFDGIGGWAAGLDELFSIGTLDYRNGSVTATDLSGVDLRVSLDVLTPALPPTSFEFQVDIVNTSNDCMPLPDCADDRLFIRSQVSGTRFLLDGLAYTLALIGFSEDGGSTTTREFGAPEGGTRRAELFARIQRDLPAPDPGLLLGAGLVLVGLLGRRSPARRRG